MKAILVLLLASEVMTRFSLIPSGGERKDVLSRTSGALIDVLEAVQETGYCSLALITDGTVPHHTVFKILSELPATDGYGLVEIPFYELGANETESLLHQVLQGTRKLRQSLHCLIIVLVSENPEFFSLFGEVSATVRLLVWSTRLLVVTDLSFSELHGLFGSYRTFSRMNAMVINEMDSKNGCNIYSYFPYRTPGHQIVKVAHWTSFQGLVVIENTQLFPQKYNDFYGTEQPVSAVILSPYWIMKTKTSPDGKSQVELSGREYLLLDVVAKKLNFTFTFTPAAIATDMVGFLVKRKDSFASVMRIAILPHLMKKVDYTMFIERATYTFTMAKPTLKPQWQSLYLPLTDAVWGCVLLLLLVMPLFLIMIMNTAVDDREPSTKKNNSIVLQTIGLLLGQDTLHGFSSSHSTRLLLMSWMIFAFIIGTGYRGNLTAFLTIPKYPKRIETLEQLAQSKAVAKFLPKASVFYDYFKRSELPSYKAVSQRSSFIATPQEGLREALETNMAYFHERLNVGINIASHFTNADGQSKLYVAKENVMPGYAAWMVPHDAPYRDNINRILMPVFEAGLLNKWAEDVMRDKKREILRQRQNNKNNRTSNDILQKDTGGNNGLLALTVVHIQGPLFILFIGIGLASFIFLAELIINYQQKEEFKIPSLTMIRD